MITRRSLLLAAAALPFARHAVATTTVPAYNTYFTYPFVAVKGGLAEDFVTLLNRQRVAGVTFAKKQMTRAKLTKEIAAEESRFAGAILFLNPKFIDDEDRQRFLWSDPLFTDHNVFVFRRPPPAKLNEETLRGLTFGGVLDYRIEGLDSLIEKRAVRRVNSESEEASLKKLLGGEVDFVLMTRAMYQHLAGQLKPATPLHVVANPWVPSFTRHLAVARENEALAKSLFAFVRELPRNAEWQALLGKYHLR